MAAGSLRRSRDWLGWWLGYRERRVECFWSTGRFASNFLWRRECCLQLRIREFVRGGRREISARSAPVRFVLGVARLMRSCWLRSQARNLFLDPSIAASLRTERTDFPGAQSLAVRISVLVPHR